MEEQRKDQTEVEENEVHFFGDHLNEKSVEKAVMSLLEQRAYIDGQCFCKLNEVKDYLPEEVEIECNSLVNTRINVNDLLLKLLAGDPAVLKKLKAEGRL